MDEEESPGRGFGVLAGYEHLVLTYTGGSELILHHGPGIVNSALAIVAASFYIDA